MCREKVAFKSEHAAKASARAIQNKHKGRKTRPYHCPNCYMWHLSSIIKDWYPGKN